MPPEQIGALYSMNPNESRDLNLSVFTLVISIATLVVMLVYLFKWQPNSCVLEPVGSSLAERAEA
jgi:hypothetical protein